MAGVNAGVRSFCLTPPMCSTVHDGVHRALTVDMGVALTSVGSAVLAFMLA
jgi:hypothetical protein